MPQNNVIAWAYFPRNQRPSDFSKQIVRCFEDIFIAIDSKKNNAAIAKGNKEANSDRVLAAVRPGLELIGFNVESGKGRGQRVEVPVLFGREGRPQKTFHADAHCETERYVLEVEAGRAVINFQFLKDIFQASVMSDVDYLCIAVRQVYQRNRDFEAIYDFLDTLYTSGRLRLPLKGILLIGY